MPLAGFGHHILRCEFTQRGQVTQLTEHRRIFGRFRSERHQWHVQALRQAPKQSAACSSRNVGMTHRSWVGPIACATSTGIFTVTPLYPSPERRRNEWEAFEYRPAMRQENLPCQCANRSDR